MPQMPALSTTAAAMNRQAAVARLIGSLHCKLRRRIAPSRVARWHSATIRPSIDMTTIGVSTSSSSEMRIFGSHSSPHWPQGPTPRIRSTRLVLPQYLCSMKAIGRRSGSST